MKYADVSTAVNRWTIIHSMKAELVNSLLDMCGMSESSARHKETQPPRMKKDNNDLKILKELVTAALDPFDDKINKDYLFNMPLSYIYLFKHFSFMFKSVILFLYFFCSSSLCVIRNCIIIFNVV